MMNRILITGAAGQLGSVLREKLKGHAKVLRLSDMADLGPAGEGEEIVPCDISDGDAVMDLVEGCDGIVHLGGISVEKSFDLIESANLRGVHNLYEAARAHGRPRIVFASSNHTIGYHDQTTRLDHTSPYRPDGYYGVSKIFGEAVASLYWDKFGQESALVRIGSCTPKPLNWRMLATWLSEDDFVSLIDTVFRAPRLGCTMIWGASNNDAGWWDNSHADFLGWKPKDNSADYLDEIARTVPRPGPEEPVAKYQGGVFTDEPIHKS
ncbi:NAD-dependent epimerase/dehydratase family protein [Salipiger mucosus]|uniref:UDP-glucose 4-epimerase n=1 Tax=Salipiger mucosus DSM 16094 TaxID=1123237 RepID=S9Q2K5_9RHOB|nr:NAD(P)-dependent oxidoreductase [Salipiger mucosus]EPX75511.1 UDP-glucose 4-epimerase [Salipiger mucosus DSM 16094]